MLRILIAITTRDELPAHLDNTIESVRSAFGESANILVLDDGSSSSVMCSESVYRLNGAGIGPARDAAIAIAQCESYSHVMLLDSHMRLDWSALQALSAYEEQCDTKTALACLRCDALSDDWDFLGVKGHGARIKRIFAEPVKREHGVRLHRMWESSWNNSYTDRYCYDEGHSTQIGSLLGACYVIPVDHYMSTLNRPWQTCQGWGTSEATISIPQWILGGHCVCLPGRAGHLFGTDERVKAKKLQRYPFQLASHIHNQLRLAHALGIGTISADYMEQNYHPRLPYATAVKQAKETARRDPWAQWMRGELREDQTLADLVDYCDAWETSMEYVP